MVWLYGPMTTYRWILLILYFNPVNLYVLFGEFNPFMFRIITDREGFII